MYLKWILKSFIYFLLQYERIITNPICTRFDVDIDKKVHIYYFLRYLLCNYCHPQTSLPEPRHFLHSPLHGLAFCWSHKTGSTSVAHLLATLNNASFIIDNNLYYRCKRAMALNFAKKIQLSGCQKWWRQNQPQNWNQSWTPVFSSLLSDILCCDWSALTGGDHE